MTIALDLYGSYIRDTEGAQRTLTLTLYSWCEELCNIFMWTLCGVM